LCGEIAEHGGRLFHLNIRWPMRKGSRESGPGIDPGALLKNRITTLLNDSSTASGLPNILTLFFIRLNQLNITMHGKGKILLDVPETSSCLNVKCSCGSINLHVEKYLLFWH